MLKRWHYSNNCTGKYFFCHKWLFCSDTKMLRIKLNVHLAARILLRTRAFTKPLLFILAIHLRMTYLRRKISPSHVRPNLETERQEFHTMNIKHRRKMQLCLSFWLNFYFSAWKKQYLEDNKKHCNLKTYSLFLGILEATNIRFFFHYCIFLANFIFFATYFTYYPINENGNTERKSK